jgi:hypothetical protein
MEYQGANEAEEQDQQEFLSGKARRALRSDEHVGLDGRIWKDAPKHSAPVLHSARADADRSLMAQAMQKHLNSPAARGMTRESVTDKTDSAGGSVNSGDHFVRAGGFLLALL